MPNQKEYKIIAIEPINIRRQFAMSQLTFSHFLCRHWTSEQRYKISMIEGEELVDIWLYDCVHFFALRVFRGGLHRVPLTQQYMNTTCVQLCI